MADPQQSRERQVREKEHDGAIAQARLLAERHPDSVVALSRLAQTLASTGNYAEAVDLSCAVLELCHSTDGPTDVSVEMSAFVALRILLSAGRIDEAERFLSEHHSQSSPWTLLFAGVAEGRELLAEIEGLTEFVHSIADGDAPYETRTGSDGIHSYETCVYCGTDEGKSHNRWCLWVKANAALATLDRRRERGMMDEEERDAAAEASSVSSPTPAGVLKKRSHDREEGQAMFVQRGRR